MDAIKVLNYNPGQKFLGQYWNIHIFLSFHGSLLKQCIIFEIFLQFFLPPSYTKLKLGKNSESRVQHCLWGEGRGWTCVNWKTPQKRKSVPRLLSMVVGMYKEFHLSIEGIGKGYLFVSKMIYKRVRVWTPGRRHPVPENFFEYLREWNP